LIFKRTQDHNRHHVPLLKHEKYINVFSIKYVVIITINEPLPFVNTKFLSMALDVWSILSKLREFAKCNLQFLIITTTENKYLDELMKI